MGGRVVGGDHMTFDEEEFDSLETVIEDRCDLIEVNEVYDSHWEQREFTQILFYDYRNKMDHLIGEREWDFFIGDWRILDVGSLRYSDSRKEWVVAFYDEQDGIIRMVHSEKYKHTKSNYDQEMESRKRLPQEERTTILSFS